MASGLKDSALQALIPGSIKDDAEVSNVTKALDPVLCDVTDETAVPVILARIRELPERVIDLLAWQFHVDFYEPLGLSLEIKRRLVLSSILWHRRKGTPWAIRRLLADLGMQSEYQEWWEFEGVPYTARLKVWIGDDLDLSMESRDLIIRAFNSAKSTRTHLAKLAVGVWMSDQFELQENSDAVMIATSLPFLEIYPWGGLRYGFFDYGDLIRYGAFTYGEKQSLYGNSTEGTHQYGEDMPDLMDLSIVRMSPMVETYRVPALYGSVRYGDFAYGEQDGPQDNGAYLKINHPLIYGQFSYGEGCPEYGAVRYGDFSYGGRGRPYGGETTEEVI